MKRVGLLFGIAAALAVSSAQGALLNEAGAFGGPLDDVSLSFDGTSRQVYTKRAVGTFVVDGSDATVNDEFTFNWKATASGPTSQQTNLGIVNTYADDTDIAGNFAGDFTTIEQQTTSPADDGVYDGEVASGITADTPEVAGLTPSTNTVTGNINLTRDGGQDWLKVTISVATASGSGTALIQSVDVGSIPGAFTPDATAPGTEVSFFVDNTWTSGSVANLILTIDLTDGATYGQASNILLTTTVTAIPEPSTVVLGGMALFVAGGAGVVRRRRKARQQKDA